MTSPNSTPAITEISGESPTGSSVGVNIKPAAGPAIDTTALLSELCPYCNANPPKYRCPACDAKTCSVACSKRHKVFKQCSGARDPTAFVKRKHLATPTVLNRDFNFLTGVETVLNRKTEDGEEESGNKIQGAEQRKREFLQRSGVTVKKAPQGMKRARENKTDVYGSKKHKALHWTVEWILIDEENKRILDDRVTESQTITNSYFYPLTPSITNSNPISDDVTESPRLKGPKSLIKETRFYLRKPETPANRPVLIVLPGEKSLKDCLIGKTVLEFPTIYVTAKKEDPEGFAIEQPLLVEISEEIRNTAESKPKAETTEKTTDGEVSLNAKKSNAD
ncbi:Box C/D snoRNA accumulation [Rhizina undulata]